MFCCVTWPHGSLLSTPLLHPLRLSACGHDASSVKNDVSADLNLYSIKLHLCCNCCRLRVNDQSWCSRTTKPAVVVGSHASTLCEEWLSCWSECSHYCLLSVSQPTSGITKRVVTVFQFRVTKRYIGNGKGFVVSLMMSSVKVITLLIWVHNDPFSFLAKRRVCAVWKGWQLFGMIIMHPYWKWNRNNKLLSYNHSGIQLISPYTCVYILPTHCCEDEEKVSKKIAVDSLPDVY